MNKEEYIKKHGKAAYEKQQQQTRDWRIANPDKVKATSAKHNPESNRKNNPEISRKDGKYYKRRRQYQMDGVPHERELVRGKHQRHYTQYKKIIDPEGLTQIHHEWIPETADFRGVALVEKDQHQHGYIDVIQILEGEITLLTEEEIKNKS